MNRFILFFPLLMMIASTARADVIENLNRPGSSITVEQPQLLTDRLQPSEAVASDGAETEGDSAGEEREERERPVQMSRGKVVGYRVQVYADNNARVAKGEARKRERAISSRFPYGTYVAYVSPYWRLRVGDFKTRAEAEKAAVDLRRSFPSYAKEIRVVRDRINSK